VAPTAKGNTAEVSQVETKASSLSATRIPELDGLRGLAILLVLIWHFGYICNSANGHRWLFYVKDSTMLFWSGVDLFFVLSGFLIGGILLDARNSPNYFKAFYVRRAFRILPLYAVLVVMFYLGLRAGVPARIAGAGWLFGPTAPWYAYATFTQNIRYATGGTDLAMWISATWSLAIEEQFYLVLPAIIWLVPERKLLYVILGGIVAAPALRVLLDLSYVHGQDASFNLMPCRADSLLLGVAGAMMVRHAPSWEALKSHRRWLVSAWLGLLAGLPFMILFKQTNATHSLWMSTVGFSWLAFFYLGLLLLGLIYSQGWLGRVLRSSWLKELGTISYGVYLIHYPVLGMTFALIHGKSPWAETPAERLTLLLALVLSLAIATFSWKVFEKPLLKIGQRLQY